MAQKSPTTAKKRSGTKSSGARKSTGTKKPAASSKNSTRASSGRGTGTRSSAKKASPKSGKVRGVAAARPDERVGREVRIAVAAVAALLLILSNAGIGGAAGSVVKGVLFGLFGLMAYCFPFALFFGYAFFVANRRNALIGRKMFGGILLFVFLCAFLQLLTLGFRSDIPVSEFYRISSEDSTGGGIIGGAVTYVFGLAFGTIGAYVLTVAGLVIAAIILTQKPLFTSLGLRSRSVAHSMRARHRLKREEARRERERREEEEDYYVDLDEDYGASPLNRVTLTREEEAPKKKSAKKTAASGGTTAAAKTEMRASAPKKQPAPMPADEDETVFAMPSFLRGNEIRPAGSFVSGAEKPAPKDKLDIEISGLPEPYESMSEEQETAFTPDPAGNMKAEEAAAAPEKKEKNKESTPEERQKDIASIQSEIEKKAPKKPDFKLPPLNLLARGKPVKGDSRQHLMDTAEKLQQTLENFGVNVKVVNVSRGPTVTRYELQPEMGVKVSRIINLQDDIKLNLATSEIRIEAPIPGKAAVGIEVPNKEIAPVMLREIIDCPEFQDSKAKIPFAVGKDIGGRPIITDIEKMPHLLIAGATGSGKSVCINTLIMSILFRCTPDDVRFLMIDPKVVELKIYDGIPHLLIPVVTDAKKAAGALNWAVQEMTERYNKFASYPGVRDIRSYNERVKKMNQDLDEAEKIDTMSRIVVIVDELADLMMVASSEVEDAICRLAQLARAAGIHLIIATQRPSVNVVTGLIKANMPSRIALAVTSGIDSRTILDMNGAEKLLGKGDMLFYPQGYPKPARVQGAYVSDGEITDVVNYLSSQAEDVEYNKEVEERIAGSMEASVSGTASLQSDDGRDEYFADSARLIIEKDKASIGMLQRAFKIGFNRAARIMDQLSEAGVVGGEEGTKPRKILMTMEEFEQMMLTE